MPQVQLSAVRFDYPDPVPAATGLLSGIDLDIADGQYVCLVGNSGSGKSTLLRLIAGLLRPDAGIIRIGGVDVDGVPPHRRDVAMVFQGDALYPHLSVARQLSVGRAKTNARDSARLSDIVRFTRIEGLLDRFADGLSGGELKRVGLAKALIRNAGVRLLDEPLSGIDASHRQTLADFLTKVHQRGGGVTLHVTHDGQEAVRVADSIAVLHDGRIVQKDDPGVLLDKPEHRATCRLLTPWGLNEFAFASASESGSNRIELDNLSDQDMDTTPTVCILPQAVSAECIESSSTPMPANVRPTLQRIGGDRWAIVGNLVRRASNRFTVSLPLHTHGRSDEGDTEALLRLNVAGHDEATKSAEPGRPVRMVFADDAVHFFDADGWRQDTH
ncbi:Maltose/maltodextrin import ATP-binding protein MalK [Crateriforma conspicua]|uniref:Maltose/maltodextrin import ATP-binding protein MalK n=1 Tax=Crateriforma conspicua TaxID=2527996 RepID=A0A5C6FI55_9PLAN|nr:ABC transporter ATP-binding protein [Crateriforma conspicua]TWU61707.1 Maltose/maltodextrin import ATP-binding protein MalK [Crateriforma conspicua]